MTVTNKRLVEILTTAIEKPEIANALIQRVINTLSRQPEQEPVAWMEIEKYTEGDKQFEQTLVRPYNSGRGVPLYTTPPHPWIDNKQTGNFFSVPPPQREWQNLNAADMRELGISAIHLDMAKAISAKLREKNSK